MPAISKIHRGRNPSGSQSTNAVSGTSLLSHARFDDMFHDLRGSSVYFHGGLGWIGDDLIDWSARRLFNYYGMSETSIDRCDVVLESGGGNLGTGYPLVFHARQRLYAQAARFHKPVILLPKSLYGDCESFPACVSRIYARESQTRSLVPGAVLAPDLALSFAGLSSRSEPTCEFGLFLRREDGRFGQSNIPENRGDPRFIVRKHAVELFELASTYRTICTDRLHFAIAALTLGRRVILLPDATFKNRAMYSTWLQDVGCEWSDEPVTGMPSHITTVASPTVDADDLLYSVWHSGPSPDVLTHVLCLMPDGVVGWQGGKQKSSWSITDEGRLVFADHHGAIAESFSVAPTNNAALRGETHPDGSRTHMRLSNITANPALLVV